MTRRPHRSMKALRIPAGSAPMPPATTGTEAPSNASPPEPDPVLRDSYCTSTLAPQPKLPVLAASFFLPGASSRLVSTLRPFTCNCTCTCTCACASTKRNCPRPRPESKTRALSHSLEASGSVFALSCSHVARMAPSEARVMVPRTRAR